MEKVIEDFKAYLEDNDISLTSINLPEDANSPDVKSDLSVLSEFYIKYFNEFSRAFSNCDMDEARIIINDETIIHLIRFSFYKNSSSIFGRSRDKQKLESYVLDNYNYIVWFFDMFREVADETD